MADARAAFLIAGYIVLVQGLAVDPTPRTCRTEVSCDTICVAVSNTCSPDAVEYQTTEVNVAQSSKSDTTEHRTTQANVEPSSEALQPAVTFSPVISDMCVVARIVDGDTIECKDRTRVRLLLIDAPEKNQIPFGPEATRALEQLVPVGTTLLLETDVQRRDPYNRLLAYAYLPGGQMVNLEMARRGYAVVAVYPPNVRHVERIREAVEEAQAARRGLWSTDAFSCQPADHRRGRC